ncbi:MAG: hypothetical protein JOZ62_04215 [Acidobacteriaceae bacterium]|nr:hypothetical protein [Acidobacteriaceae bacterium]
MTRLWRICSKFVAATVLGNGIMNAATIEGNVHLTVSSSSSHVRQQLLSDIAVWLEPVHVPLMPVAQPAHVTLLQKNKTFTPHVLIVSVGTVVDFPNADPIFHNAFSSFDGQIFDIGLYPPGSSRSVRFRRPGVVRVFCNIHPAMSALIIVVDTPYFTKVNREGQFRLVNVSDGDYELHTFDERSTAAPETRSVLSVTGANVTVQPLSI